MARSLTLSGSATISRSSVSAERLTSQAKAGEPIQNSAKNARDAGAGRADGERDGQADQRDDHRAVHQPVVADERIVAALCACEAVRHSSSWRRLTNRR